jgi:NAD-dependent deacetylase sirtuin 2
LYATLNADLLTADPIQRAAIREDPTLALDQTLFVQNQLPLLETKRDFILGTYERRWKATLAHRFIELLHTKTGKLVREYTQNIDGLEDQCQNLPHEKVIAVHGSMDRAECAICGESSDFTSFCEAVRDNIKDISGRDSKAPKNSTPIACRVCGAHALKPAIVLFRSSLPKIFFENVPSDVNDADLLLVMGTSLRVAPANSLVWRVPKNCMRVLVNKEPAGMQLGMSFGDDDECKRDFFAEGDIDEVLLELMDCLGWIEDLEPLLACDSLPESSVRLLREHLDRRQQTKEIESMQGKEAV